MRARSEILTISAALNQLSEKQNDAMCLFLPRLMETKNFNIVLSFLSTLPPHLTELSKGFQAECFNFAQREASIQLCINKLSDAAVKSELKADCEKFDSDLGELRTPDGLADSCLDGCLLLVVTLTVFLLRMTVSVSAELTHNRSAFGVGLQQLCVLSPLFFIVSIRVLQTTARGTNPTYEAIFIRPQNTFCH